jgi:hypothetical protein
MTVSVRIQTGHAVRANHLECAWQQIERVWRGQEKP